MGIKVRPDELETLRAACNALYELMDRIEESTCPDNDMWEMANELADTITEFADDLEDRA